MSKRSNKYRLRLEQVSLANQEGRLHESLLIDFENHDELFGIIELVKEKNLFDDERQSVEFTLGLKLCSEVMLKNKTHPLFKEFLPAMGAFMKKLKDS